MDLLLEPLGYAFFRRALAAGVVIGALCGALSTFVVLRRASYIGHGLAHSVLGGIAVAVAAGYDLYLGAVAATLLAAVLIDRVSRRGGLHVDAAIGVVTTSMFALGIAVVSLTQTQRISTEAVLFGNVLGVSQTDLVVASAVGVVFAAILLTRYKQLVFVSFDPEVAAVQGIRAGVIELLINVLTAGVVIVSVRVLGVLLVAAAVVIPASVARLVTSSFGAMLSLATVLGVAFSVIGLYASAHLDVASGPTIVLAGAAVFALAFVGTQAGARRRVRKARTGPLAPVEPRT